MLSATQLDVARGGRTIVENVTLDADAGCVLLIHGANGSGKSTLMAALAGLLPAARGDVRWRGMRLRDDPARFRRDLAFLGHANGLSGELSVAENLRFAGLLGGALRSSPEQSVLEDAGLAGLRHVRVDRLSRGQRRRVALARLVLDGKPLWLLDEPTDSLDDLACVWFAACIDTHTRHGGTVVAATHRPLATDAARTRHLHFARSAPCCA
ncbi:ABC transporter involved in cytochrome c biogeneis, ATPase component CcmA [Candidatus Burkholderia verschuerenii]|uniref:ABC transporter involved in cytochrome c biogeneis, ATPase component CcmA n=1 Tax=Candidatus Burkholderia verschuerenii TaxID=242163 RepID=A0A0L0LW38_9BURK|nr:heme ABC exporter ATP-binding protein CcmA [Candidatus Burkholderia verschuerenii]KND54276.1 ABC transporter involved in cytochrome c biogeneis, ATPase component CcmA [Candidatus Burkholderia verschuerenii]